jgi:hypothetical protein
LVLLLVFVGATLVLGAWTSASAVVGSTCTKVEQKQASLAKRDGYYLGCGAGSAVIKRNGTTYRMTHSKCYIGSGGARLYFGLQRFGDMTLKPQNALYLVLDSFRRVGTVDVGDGSLELVTGTHVAILGSARVQAGLKRGTFTVFEHVGSGVTNRHKFTGSWNCSGPVK